MRSSEVSTKRVVIPTLRERMIAGVGARRLRQQARARTSRRFERTLAVRSRLHPLGANAHAQAIG
jgi:hypothetical protein